MSSFSVRSWAQTKSEHCLLAVGQQASQPASQVVKPPEAAAAAVEVRRAWQIEEDLRCLTPLGVRAQPSQGHF